MPTFVSADGTELAYRVTGTGPVLACLPGGPGRAGAYLADLGPALPGHSLVLLDNRGTGASGTPATADSYRVTRLVDDIESLRLELGLDRLPLLAHSSAGNTALLYAIRYPERVAALILVAPSTRVAGVAVEGFESALGLRAHEPWYPAAREAVLRWAGCATIAESLPYREAAAPLFYGRWDTAAREHAAREPGQLSLPAAEGFYTALDVDPEQVRQALGRLRTPVLVVTGELDPFPTPATGRRFAGLLTNGESYVQPAAGHYPWLDDPVAFAAAVTAFLRRVPPR